MIFTTYGLKTHVSGDGCARTEQYISPNEFANGFYRQQKDSTEFVDPTWNDGYVLHNVLYRRFISARAMHALRVLRDAGKAITPESFMKVSRRAYYDNLHVMVGFLLREYTKIAHLARYESHAGSAGELALHERSSIWTDSFLSYVVEYIRNIEVVFPMRCVSTYLRSKLERNPFVSINPGSDTFTVSFRELSRFQNMPDLEILWSWYGMTSDMSSLFRYKVFKDQWQELRSDFAERYLRAGLYNLVKTLTVKRRVRIPGLPPDPFCIWGALHSATTEELLSFAMEVIDIKPANMQEGKEENSASGMDYVDYYDMLPLKSSSWQMHEYAELKDAIERGYVFKGVRHFNRNALRLFTFSHLCVGKELRLTKSLVRRILLDDGLSYKAAQEIIDKWEFQGVKFPDEDGCERVNACDRGTSTRIGNDSCNRYASALIEWYTSYFKS